jgi:hypothetical protein
MGQYYSPVSMEKKEHVCSHDYANGMKLMEHSWIGNNFVAVVEELIAEGGRWYGDRIVWAGDYADPEVPEIPNPKNGSKPSNLFDIVGDNKIEPKPSETEFRYIINLDTKEFVDKRKVPVSETWTDSEDKNWDCKIHPLPLLTCEGNGRGGGDYHGEHELIGKWARQRVTVSTRKPKGYKEIIFDLVE